MLNARCRLARAGRGETTPRRLRVYANRANIVDFSEVDNAQPSLNISLLEGETGVTEYPLRIAAFSSINSLSLFFVRNSKFSYACSHESLRRVILLAKRALEYITSASKEKLECYGRKAEANSRYPLRALPTHPLQIDYKKKGLPSNPLPNRYYRTLFYTSNSSTHVR